MVTKNNQKVFLELVRAGLWEKEARLSQFGKLDFEEIMRLAEEQAVMGLVTAGLKHVQDTKVPQDELLQFVGQTIQIEQQNKAMNDFLDSFYEKLQKAGITAVLIKGQGISQCYERPLWRNSGDIDLLLDEENYEKAKSFVATLADTVEKENHEIKHIGYTVEGWIVELHGTLHCGLSKKMDRMLDFVQFDTFKNNYRVWKNGVTSVNLPEVNNDIIFVFTHYLKHFYKGGLGLRQICDWCRLLWTYRDTIDTNLLEHRLLSMNLASEWKAFGTYVVNNLGMPSDSLPLYEENTKWDKKANRINQFLLTVGNMGYNRDIKSLGRKSFVARKVESFKYRVVDFFNHALIFPLDSLRFFPSIIFNGLRLAVKGIG